MKAKHTPGPWEVWESYDTNRTPCFEVRANRGNITVFRTIHNESEPPASKTALINAKLIAAAPDMIAKLQNIVERINISLLNGSKTYTAGFVQALRDDALEVIKKATEQ